MQTLKPPSTVDRYFTLHYGMSLARRVMGDKSSVDVKPPVSRVGKGAVNSVNKVLDKSVNLMTGEDTCIARHHNGICMVCLSPRHPIVQQGKTLRSVEYRLPFREVRGKRKRGGNFVESVTRLCTLTCDSGEEYVVKCAVKGALIEYNSTLEDDPSMAMKKPLTNGYLAIVLPTRHLIRTAVDGLKSQKEYDKLWESSATAGTTKTEDA